MALLLGAGAIGLAPIFVRLSEVGPVATAFYRLVFALPALWAWYGVERSARARRLQRWRTADAAERGCNENEAVPRARDSRGFLLAGFCFAGDLAVWHWSLQFTSVANATLFPNFAPLFVTLAGFAFFGERFSRLFLGGMALAILGAVVLVGKSVSLGEHNLLGDALALTTAVFYAGYIVAVGRLRTHHSTASIMAWSGLVTAALLLPVALLSGEKLLPSTIEGVVVLAALGLISHACGQSLIAYALAHLPAAFSAVGLLLQPAVAAIIAWIVFDEALGPQQALGAAIILFGIGLARQGSRR